MNCPMCEKGLISVGMVKDRSGYPTFTLRCPEHGNIGKNTFKQGFSISFYERPSRASRGFFIDDWNQLLLALVQEDRFNPTNWARLRPRADNGSLDGYLREVLESLAKDEGAVSPGHIEMGTCGRCNGRALFNRGFRIRINPASADWFALTATFLTESLGHALRTVEENPSW